MNIIEFDNKTTLIVIFSLITLSIMLKPINMNRYLIFFPMIIYWILTETKKLHFINLIYIFLGYVIGIITIKFIVYIRLRKKISTIKLFLLKAKIEPVFYEEIVFRIYLIPALIMYLSDFCTNFVSVLIAITISSLLFTIYHSIDDYRDFIEILNYSILLSITSLLCPLMNLGVHYGRNNYLEIIGNENKYEIYNKNN